MGAVAGQLERVIEEVRDLLRRLDLPEAIVFGSRVTGDYLDTSDVDLILISPRFRGVRVRERAEQVHRCWQGAEELEALPYTPEEFERAREDSGVIQAALRHGLRVSATGVRAASGE